MYVVTSSVGTMYSIRQGGRGIGLLRAGDLDPSTSPTKNAIKGAHG